MKRILALLLAFVMLFGMVACGNTNQEDSKPSEESKPAESQGNETTEEPAETEEPKMYWELLGEVVDSSDLPDWEGETVEVTMWHTAGSDFVFGEVSENDVVLKEFTRVTGITFNYEESYGNGGDTIDGKLPKVIASGDLPTIAAGWNVNSQMQELFANDYLVDLTPYYDNGDLSYVEYWMPREVGGTTAYVDCKTEDGKYYAIPEALSFPAAYNITGYSPAEWDADFYAQYGSNPVDLGGMSATTSIMVRDDVLKALYPEAKTMDEIQALWVQNGTFTEEEIFDVPLETAEDFYQFLRDVQAELATGNYTGLNGDAVEVTYGNHSESDNYEWAAYLAKNILPGLSHTDGFSTIIKDEDASTPLIEMNYENEVYLDFLKNLNDLVNEGVISRNSFIDNASVFQEKKLNGQYAVVYGYGTDVPSQNEERDWDYRPVYIKRSADTDLGGFAQGGTSNKTLSIFNNVLTDEQLEQLIHAINYLYSPVGTKMLIWGPASAGLFTEDANGYRTFNDPELEANLLYGTDNEAAYNYGLRGGTCSTKTQFNRWMFSIGFDIMKAQYVSGPNLERTEAGAFMKFNPGLYEEHNFRSNADYITSNTNIYSYGKAVAGVASWWDGRAGFEQALTKVLVAEPGQFDVALADLIAYCESVGLDEAAVAEVNELFISLNQAKLDEAGVAY